MDNYVMTHCHTTYSIGDSTTQPEVLIQRAKDAGMKAICITEHGNCYNWIKKKQYCDKIGIKFIFGIECYLTRTIDELLKDNYHTILIAKNIDGVHEINRLIYTMNQDDGHMYYRPRITFEEFCNISNNVITTSACLGSPLREMNEDDEWFDRLIARYDYLEIQPHVVDKQIKYNHKIIDYAQRYNKQIITGTDTHEIDEYHVKCRLMYMIGRAKAQGATYYDDASDFDLSFKTLDEVIDMYEKQGLDRDMYMKSLENTNILSDMVEDFKLDTTYKYPDMYKNPFNSLRTYVYDRLNWLIDNKIVNEEDCDSYIQRIEEEMEVFEKLDMGSFMLYKHNNSLECWNKGIPIGDGRGSVTGSLVAYLLRITEVDPLKWNTNFARFCNVNRYSLGDIDSDISPDQRQQAYDMIQRDFTKENSAYIITFMKMKVKSIVDYVCRALDIPKEKMVEIKNGYGEIEKEQLSVEKQFKAERIQEEEYNEKMAALDKKMEDYISQFDDIFYYYKGINGAINAIGKHACGIVGSPIPLKDNVGTFYNKKSGSLLVQCDMKSVDSLNYVKYDMLSLKTLQVLREVYEMRQQPYPLAHEINWHDEAVFESIKESSVGLFQFEASNSFNRLKQFDPHTVQDIAFVSGIIRPSCASFVESAIKKIPHKNPSTAIDEILSDTYGYLIYQEQIISFLQKSCGFSQGEADVIRRCLHKDSLVTLSSGKRVPIKDINVGDEVLCVDDSMKIQKSIVINKWNNGIRRMIKIKTKLGHEIICTPDHKMLSNGKWIEAKDLKIGDCLYANKLIKYDLMSVNIVSIEYFGEDECYDIEVDSYHNFIAEGLVTHNCIGKKDQKLLDEWIPKITEGYIINSGKERDVAEKEFNEFLVILINASDYGFSYNHAIAYSMITYRCAYARHYYPAEFITAYLNNATTDEDIVDGTELARMYGIEIRNPKFGKSSGKYSVQDGVIYKGVGSILNVSVGCGDSLYELSKKYDFTHKTFLDIITLSAEEKCQVDKTNLSTLIKIGYFSEFGKIETLLKTYDIYKKYYKRKTVSKEDHKILQTICDNRIKSGDEEFVERKGSYKVNGEKVCKDLIDMIPDKDSDDIDKIIYQLSYLNYIQDEELLKYDVGIVKYISNKNNSACISLYRDNKDKWYNRGSFELNKDDIVKINLTSQMRTGRRMETVLVDIDILELYRKKEKK